MQDDRCEDPTPHLYHTYTKEVSVTCNGLTLCGVSEHTPHELIVERTVWCPGICDCHTRSGELHGPGAHK